MQPSPSPSTHFARALAWLSLMALIAYPAVLLWRLAVMDIPQAYVAAFPALTIAVPPEGWRLWALIGLDTLEIAVTLLILWQVRGIFSAFAQGPEPTADVARRLSLTGVLLLAQAALALVVRAGESVLLTLANAPGERQLSIAFSSAEIALLIAGGLLLCTGRALGHGAAALADTRSII